MTSELSAFPLRIGLSTLNCIAPACDPENQPVMSASLIRSIRSLSREGAATASARAEVESSRELAWQSATKVNPIKMSPDNASPAEPSPCRKGEGPRDRTKANPVGSGRGLNDRLSYHRRSGVSGGGMSGRQVGIKDEICGGPAWVGTPGASGEPARPGWLPQKSERPIVAMKARNGAGAKGPHLVDVPPKQPRTRRWLRSRR